MMKRSTLLTSAGLLACLAGSAFGGVTELTLNANFNGLVHAGEANSPDAPDGYRSISDRGLNFSAGIPAGLAASGRAGSTLTYGIVSAADVLDIVHVGDRNTVSAGGFGYDDFDGVDGDNIGVSPNWQLGGTSDQTGPQTTSFGGITMGSGAEVGVLLQVSNGGGDIDMTLGFTDLTTVTVTLNAPDWFGAQAPGLPNAGVAFQETRGTFPGTDQVDFANNPATDLNVVEAQVSAASLLSGQGFDIDGKVLDSVTFSNRSNAGAGYAILAASVEDGVGNGACCLDDGTCFDGTALDCSGALGAYQGDGTLCATAMCPDLRGACCFDDGGCLDFDTDANCVAGGGTFQGPGSDCVSAMCPDLRGACCLAGGFCFVDSEQVCIDSGGAFQTAGSDCETGCAFPANDDCLTAQMLGTLPATTTGSTILAADDTVPACDNQAAPGVWYSFVGTGVETNATTCAGFDPSGQADADYDSTISVYTDCGALVCVAGDDDGPAGCGTTSAVTFPTVSGVEYFVFVHGFAVDDLGNFTLSVFTSQFGACCFNDGSCFDLAAGVCSLVSGNFQGDGTDCGSSFCENAHADDTSLGLAYNWNGIVHAPIAEGEQFDPDNANGYRSISDRGLRIEAGVAPDVASAGATLPYAFNTNSFELDIIHVGDRNLVDGMGKVFDAAVDGDDIGVEPAWLNGSTDQSTSSTVVSPGRLLDANTLLGVLHQASNGGSDFDVTLEFSDATSVTVVMSAPDWFSDNNPVAIAPAGGLSAQAVLAGPLSGGDGFLGASGVDIGSAGAPLTIVESVISASALLGDLAFDIAGKTLTGITFGNRTNESSGIAIVAVTVGTNSGPATLDLDYNFNGIVHSEESIGEDGDPDNLDGFRSISDRGLFFANSIGPETPASEFRYTFVEETFVVDSVALVNRNFDGVVDGDGVGVAPNWLPGGGPVDSSANPQPSIAMNEDVRFGVIYHASNGGCTFDMTLTFADAMSLTVGLSSPDWFANFDPAPAAPGPGVESISLVAGLLSGGDGFQGAENGDQGGVGAPLNIVEAVVTRDSILADLAFDIAGRTLTDVTFDNRVGGGLSIFAMSADGIGGCICEADGDPSGVSVTDLLSFLSFWFENDPQADVNGGGVDVTDLLDFLACWFPASQGADC